MNYSRAGGGGGGAPGSLKNFLPSSLVEIVDIPLMLILKTHLIAVFKMTRIHGM